MFAIFSVSFFSVLQIFLVCLAGTWLAHRGVLNARFRGSLSQLIVGLLLPCLLLSKLSVNASAANLLRWIAMPLSALAFVGLGFLVGAIVLLVAQPPRELRRVVSAATVFGNSGYIPYPLVVAIAATAPMFRDDPNAAERGMAYVSLYLVCFSPCLWGMGFPFLAHRPLRSLRPRQLLSPPIVAAFAGIVIGLVPPLRALFVAEAAPLGILIETADLLGQAVIPCALLLLGANLAEAPRRPVIPLRVLTGVVWGRLILMPLFGGVYAVTLFKLGLTPDDPMFLLVLMLESAVPPATNLIVMCQLHGKGVMAMSRILVVTYLVAVVTLTLAVAASLWVLTQLWSG